MSTLALHPEPGASPEELRWIVAEDRLPPRGIAVRLPGDLGALVREGALTEVRVLTGCVTTRAASSLDWPRIGPRVRRAVSGALGAPAEWEIDQTSPEESDRELARVARRLFDGDVGDYIRSHRGSVELVDVRDGVVGVRLRGACQGCPAAEFTLRARIERRLRDECPALVEVVAR